AVAPSARSGDHAKEGWRTFVGRATALRSAAPSGGRSPLRPKRRAREEGRVRRAAVGAGKGALPEPDVHQDTCGSLAGESRDPGRCRRSCSSETRGNSPELDPTRAFASAGSPRGAARLRENQPRTQARGGGPALRLSGQNPPERSPPGDPSGRPGPQGRAF